MKSNNIKVYIVQTVKHVSRVTGAASILKMYCAKEQLEEFYNSLGDDRSVIDSKVVFSRPIKIKSYKSVL
jgi:pyridoxal/pyridoxine/pyridoxamine kinase